MDATAERDTFMAAARILQALRLPLDNRSAFQPQDFLLDKRAK